MQDGVLKQKDFLRDKVHFGQIVAVTAEE